MNKRIKLSEWARRNNYTYRGAFNLWQAGKIKNAIQLESGTILIEETKEIDLKQEHNIIYVRVSSSENKSNLESQALRVSQFCTSKGWIVHSIVKECASGLNDKRPKLEKIFKERKATRLIVEHKDRLTRFGFNYIKLLFPECDIIVVNEVTGDKQDLMQDFISLVTSFCARIYGNRRSKSKTKLLLTQLNNND